MMMNVQTIEDKIKDLCEKYNQDVVRVISEDFTKMLNLYFILKTKNIKTRKFKKDVKNSFRYFNVIFLKEVK